MSLQNKVIRVIFLYSFYKIEYLLISVSSCSLTDNKSIWSFLWCSCLDTRSNSSSISCFWSLSQCYWRVSFSSSMWMVNWIHILTKDVWFDTLPSLSSCLSYYYIHMIFISYLSYSSITVTIKFSYLSWLKFYDHQSSKFISTCYSRITTSGSYQFTFGKWRYFKIVYLITIWYVLELFSISVFDWSLFSTNYLITNFDTLSSKYIPFFSITIVQQSNSTSSKWIILNRCYCSWYIQLIISSEINKSIEFLVSTSSKSWSYPSLIVPSSWFTKRGG